ncbi:hypothetical protein HDV06_003203 [Boothiomyces sp. JEL0866]|nr:hypothetical protein HDV06_003203 [Boothiomyces sp. JEL0866]
MASNKVHTEKRVKKPMNSFFYYRRDIKDKIVKEHGSIVSHDVSKIASECWKKESEEVKDYYKKLSAKAHAEHKANHPDYDWQWWKKKNKDPSDGYVNNLEVSSSDSSFRHLKPVLPKLTLTTPQEEYNLSKVSPDVLASTLLDSDELYYNSDNTVTFKPKSPTFQIAASADGLISDNPYDSVLSPRSECSIYSHHTTDNPYE